jgi:hypothetical protein
MLTLVHMLTEIKNWDLKTTSNQKQKVNMVKWWMECQCREILRVCHCLQSITNNKWAYFQEWWFQIKWDSQDKVYITLIQTSIKIWFIKHKVNIIKKVNNIQRVGWWADNTWFLNLKWWQIWCSEICKLLSQ